MFPSPTFVLFVNEENNEIVTFTGLFAVDPQHVEQLSFWTRNFLAIVFSEPLVRLRLLKRHAFIATAQEAAAVDGC